MKTLLVVSGLALAMLTVTWAAPAFARNVSHYACVGKRDHKPHPQALDFDRNVLVWADTEFKGLQETVDDCGDHGFRASCLASSASQWSP
jgi:hypothetical protein